MRVQQRQRSHGAASHSKLSSYAIIVNLERLKLGTRFSSLFPKRCLAGRVAHRFRYLNGASALPFATKAAEDGRFCDCKLPIYWC